jgi:hypothetical protein
MSGRMRLLYAEYMNSNPARYFLWGVHGARLNTSEPEESSKARCRG